jgi:hypothetical protein
MVTNYWSATPWFWYALSRGQYRAMVGAGWVMAR